MAYREWMGLLVRGAGAGAGGSVCASSAMEAATASFRLSLKFPLSDREHAFICPPGKRVHVCVQRGGVMARTT